MKKSRNCGGATLYPNFSQNVPMMGMQQPMMGMQQPVMMSPAYAGPYTQTYSQAPSYTQNYNNVEQQINNLEQRLNSLENRVSKLESKTTTSTYNNKYSDSNYYML